MKINEEIYLQIQKRVVDSLRQQQADQPKQNMKTLTPRQAFTKKIKMQDLTRARKQVENLAIALAPQYKAANDKFVFAQDNVMSLVITNNLTMRDCEGLVAKFEKFATA